MAVFLQPHHRAKDTKYNSDSYIQVAVLKDREGEEEAEAVSWMCKILKQCYAAAGNNPLPFFNFVIDPSSFSRSVENLFHVSLLVREQYAEITEGEC